MTQGTSLRDRMHGTSEKSVREAEAKRQQEQAEAFKASAVDRAMAKWFDQYGARKPMKVFEATVCEESEVGEEQGEDRTRDDGTSYRTPDRAVFYLKDVTLIEGTQVDDAIRFSLPDQGKDWSIHSEGAITVREAFKGPDGKSVLTDLFSLCGKRWRFEGAAVPTFQGQANANGQRFWNTQYFYRVTPLDGSAPATPKTQAPELENFRTFIGLMVEGNPDLKIEPGKRTTWTPGKLLKTYQLSGIEDAGLENMIVNSTIDALLGTAESLDICVVMDGVVSMLGTESE